MSGPYQVLEDAVDRLASEMCSLDLDVFVPLYANTFPIATVAKRAAKKTQKRQRIAIHHFDWNWSKKEQGPPFLSSRPLQIFFATEREFMALHAAGISFFAAPVSVFHPRYIFLGLPPHVDQTNAAVLALQSEIVAAFAAPRGAVPVPKPGSQTAKLTWVSDIPSQAHLLAAAVERHFGASRRRIAGDLVEFWRDRRLDEALGLGLGSRTASRRIKAFIWGGPLASVAKEDARATPASARSNGVRLRDPQRASVCIRLDSLADSFTALEIREEHALYCCVGYKENRRLKTYYLNKEHEGDTAWSLEGRKYAAMCGSEVSTLVDGILVVFEALFAAAAAANVSAPGKLFEEFQTDYDKFCRTRSPVAQLNTPGSYVRCLNAHHDLEAFKLLFPTSASPVTP